MVHDTSLHLSSLQLPGPPPLTADTALFLDFDGTLVDIAATPEDIRVAEDLGHILQSIARALDGALAVISGRAIADIDKYLGGAVPAVAGVHGAVRRDAHGVIATTSLNTMSLRAARGVLEDFVKTYEGVLLEDKGISIAVHYRAVPAFAAQCQTIVAECAAMSAGQLERLDGKMVVELKPARITKAGAISAFMNEAPFAGRVPVFAGDDITDEKGFTAVQALNGYGVIVGARTPTAARTRLPSVAALHGWLKDFCAERAI